MVRSKQFLKSLFIFRRDLRLEDNTALIAALKNSQEVICSFIFTPDQLEHNRYRGDCSLQFMLQSLEELEKELKLHHSHLYLFYGKPELIVEELISKEKIEAVFINQDYTPYSIERDKKIAVSCKKHAISFFSFHDSLLHLPDDTLKSDGTPYTIFTPFHKNASKFEVQKPSQNKYTNYFTKPILFAEKKEIFQKILPHRASQLPGGRDNALKILKHLTPFSNYAQERDFPSLDKTTHLSAHLKFNTCSIREAYYAVLNKLGPSSKLIASFYWRDFFSLISLHFPHVFKGAFREKFNALEWSHDKKKFLAWCEGKTGFPLVDAGMRQLNQTGFMHNRVRMVTASFLIKDLHINWQWGEMYFAQKLIDYDPAINNGNWQWCASTGCDAQPYFRIFNPWSQAEKFDPECQYIKKWVPELQECSNKEIHNWHKEEYHNFSTTYPAPIADHAKEAKITLRQYLKISS